MNTLALKPYPFLSFRFLKAYIITMRPYLMFISGITGILGMSFVTEINFLKSFLIFQAAFLSYGFGQALTDCFQTDTDSISSPYRPLTKGVVSKTQFLIISCLGLTYCISILAYFNPINIILGCLAGFGLTTYTYFKKKWWAGPFYNSWIVLALFLMSYFAGKGNVDLELTNPLFIAAVLTTFFGYANFVLTGYFKDIEADRVTSYNTLPVKFCRKISAYVSDSFGLIAVLTVIGAFISMGFDNNHFTDIIKAFIFLIAGLTASILSQLKLHKVNSDAKAHEAITPCVHSYILLLSALIALNKPNWFLALLFFYIFYILLLKLRPTKEQI